MIFRLEGAEKPKAKVSQEDLQMAADWLRSYESDDDAGPCITACNRVADYLEDECLRRQTESVVRKKARETGLPASRIRAQLKAMMAKS